VITPSPTEDVMDQAAREVTFVDVGFLDGCRCLIHDRDTKYTQSFDESWVKSIRTECLDRLILFGERSLRYGIGNYLAHDHVERNHQGLDNRLVGDSTTERVWMYALNNSTGDNGAYCGGIMRLNRFSGRSGPFEGAQPSPDLRSGEKIHQALDAGGSRDVKMGTEIRLERF
jgi:hypothetical protein